MTPFRLTVAAGTSSVPSPLKTMTSTIAFGCGTPPTMLNPLAENTYEPRRVPSVHARRSTAAGGKPDASRPPPVPMPLVPTNCAPPIATTAAHAATVQPVRRISPPMAPSGRPGTDRHRGGLTSTGGIRRPEMQMRSEWNGCSLTDINGRRGAGRVLAVTANVTGLLQAWSGGDPEAL